MAIAMKMAKGAVITGTIRDQGRPVAQTTVQATLVRVVNGERLPGTTMGFSSYQTDDQGTFHIYGLAPGSYAVFATPRLTTSQEVRPITEQELQWAQQQIQGRKHRRRDDVFIGRTAQARAGYRLHLCLLPGDPSAASAALVTVSAGQERAGVDFEVQYVSTARVEGTVRDLDGQPVRSGRDAVSIPKLEDAALIEQLFLLPRFDDDDASINH